MPDVEVLGPVDFATLEHHLARCRALVFPGEEDFGIVPVKAMASGRPVVAYGRGGALDSGLIGEAGLLFEERSAAGLAGAMARIEASGLDRADPARLTAHARRFDAGALRSGIPEALAGLGVRGPA